MTAISYQNASFNLNRAWPLSPFLTKANKRPVNPFMQQASVLDETVRVAGDPVAVGWVVTQCCKAEPALL